MSNDNAAIYYEASQTSVAMGALSDSGDQTNFECTDYFWSAKSGYEAVVRPDGLVSGGSIAPTATNNQVAVAASTMYQAGVLQSISANATLTVARPSSDDYCISSITVNSSQTIAVVKGTEHASAFSATRAAAGGPPLIPVGSVELGQIWATSQSAAVYTTSEVKQIIGTSQERYDFPTWNQTRMNVTSGVTGYAGVEFVAALPAVHTGAIPKAVYASYYEPEFAELPKCSDFVPPETTHSTSSKQIYGQAIGSSSSSLNQGSFTAFFEDGISDAFLSQKNENLFFKFKQNKLNTPYILSQGKLGLSRSFAAEDNPQAACTISATESAVEITS